MPIPGSRWRCMRWSLSGAPTLPFPNYLPALSRRSGAPYKIGLLMIFLSRMLAITRGHRGLLSIAVLGSVLYTALSVLPALIIRQILTALAHPSATATLGWLGLPLGGGAALV